jgi:hypothetical protein
MASFEIVERYRTVSSARQRLACMATNEAGSASYEDRWHCSLTLDVEYGMNSDVNGKRFLSPDAKWWMPPDISDHPSGV